ncbi:EAL domain-containing protein [Vibrio fluvialis]|uniref:cyclic-guanylate-specific phosphodiesterase n=1 Tax=Vibrio fluvialis TaxID=676 RepID=A0AAX2LSB5_VIBFL|nr:EAL domain-containing protein [Vibrio fluvialis]AMF95833.1 EAL domain-containing protein [Vibrio fluvialis]EKO4009773.1 EAL domain-containing protein [Vibrio fluvialis]MBY8229004.1 EAL domain-containing protein [Vibrio fluvialis]MCE7634320.1 EAL domain-containing protein [Vibrio fluvialis]SUP30706.1 Rtn protein [Vibrio fluvialis]
MTLNNKSPFRRLKLFHSCYLFIGLVLLTYGVLFFQSVQNYKSETRSRLSLSLEVLDGQFQAATEAVDNVLRHITGDCSADVNALGNTIIAVPSIQSLNVVKQGTVVCSTFEPNIGGVLPSTTFINFNVITSNIVVPGKTIVVIKSGNDDLAVAASLHGFILFGVVKILEMETPFHINTNTGWVNEKGQLVATENPDTLYIESGAFPYSISTRYDYQKMFLYFLKSDVWSLLILLLFSSAISAFYFFYDSKREVVQALSKGLKKGEFEPYAQGVTDSNGVLTGCEILMRWNYKSSLIRPDDFIPIAEKSGLIVPMSIQLIDKTYEFFLKHYYAVSPEFHVAFNISPIQLTKPHAQGLLNSVAKFRQCSKLKFIKVVLELTERQIVSYTPETLATIRKLHDMGIIVVIDDFGTGYSSLENILELNIGGLKIDKRFVDRYPSDELSASLIDNMVDLANRLKVHVVAEGVETKEQAEALRLKGVQYLQGYLFYKPLSLDNFVGALKAVH